jgi:hypothetical protein
MQAGISEAVDALTYLRRSSTSTAGGAPAAVRGAWRCSAHREKLFGRDAETCGVCRWLRDYDLPEGFQILGPACHGSKGAGERCTLAHVDSKEHRYACNEIKLPVKEFDTDRTARDGHVRAARCATPQPEQ